MLYFTCSLSVMFCLMAWNNLVWQICYYKYRGIQKGGNYIFDTIDHSIFFICPTFIFSLSVFLIYLELVDKHVHLNFGWDWISPLMKQELLWKQHKPSWGEQSIKELFFSRLFPYGLGGCWLRIIILLLAFSLAVCSERTQVHRWIESIALSSLSWSLMSF